MWKSSGICFAIAGVMFITAIPSVPDQIRDTLEWLGMNTTDWHWWNYALIGGAMFFVLLGLHPVWEKVGVWWKGVGQVKTPVTPRFDPTVPTDPLPLRLFFRLPRWVQEILGLVITIWATLFMTLAVSLLVFLPLILLWELFF